MGKKIFVVDDNEGIRETLQELLELLGYDPYLFCNGQEAIDHLKDQRPDLIISDLLMARMDGKMLTRLVKSNQEYANIPIIMLTAYPLEQSGFNCTSYMPDVFLQKPYDLQELREKVNRLLTAS